MKRSSAPDARLAWNTWLARSARPARAPRLASIALLALAAPALGASRPASAGESPYAAVTADRAITFPADEGSHPQFRTEWWYVTGWLTTAAGEDLGFQITFFRTKPPIDDSNPSAFTPHQLLIAHCAISDTRRGRLWQDQRIRRAGMGLAQAAVGSLDVSIGEWSMRRDAAGYVAHIAADDFALDLTLAPSQPPLLNGGSGVSRKGPSAASASYYYSLPHLNVGGAVKRGTHGERVTGEAWFDHEWSSEYLDAEAVGWDWVGINLNDGGALMAFRIRDGHGGTRWAGGTLRAQGRTQILEPAQVEFSATARWTSPRTGISYPVRWHLHAGARDFELEPLMNDQENDTRLSTGAIYWEGAIRVVENRLPAGRGYLELTGYGEKLNLR